MTLKQMGQPFAEDCDHLVAQILHRKNPFLRMENQNLSFLQACRGSSLHPVFKLKGGLAQIGEGSWGH